MTRFKIKESKSKFLSLQFKSKKGRQAIVYNCSGLTSICRIDISSWTRTTICISN